MQRKTPPAWSLNGGNYPDLPVEPSRWEQFLASEGLKEQDIKSHNPKVRDFVVRNFRTYFVPMKVLKMYGLDWDYDA